MMCILSLSYKKLWGRFAVFKIDGLVIENLKLSLHLRVFPSLS